MKKRLFAIMLALALVLAAVPALAEGEGEPDKTAEKVEKQETEQGVATRNSTPIEQNEQQQSNEAQLKLQPVKAPASPVGTGDCSAGRHDWTKKDGVCAECGFKCTHNWKEDDTNEIAPTCTQSGTIRLDCTICRKATRQSNANPLGHDYNDGVVTKEPTAIETGEKNFYLQARRMRRKIYRSNSSDGSRGRRHACSCMANEPGYYRSCDLFEKR